MNTAIIYCRVSTEDQVKNLSLPTQGRVCAEFCVKNCWEVVLAFIERGESAKTTNRPAFQEMLAYCQKNKNRIGYLVVYALNRFARNNDDHVIVSLALRKLGIQLRSATEAINETKEGKFLKTILSGVAELDNQMRADRTKVGLQAAVRVGRWPFHAPLGYRNARDAAEHPIIIIDHERGPLIRQGFERFATGLYTQKQVLDELTALGLRTLKGKEITKQTIEGILRNPFYAGWIKVSNWQQQRGTFEPLVQQETFDKVQAVLMGRRPTVTPRRRNRPDFPLRGIAKCGKCGAAMTGAWSTGRSKPYPYYSCSKHCPGMGVRAEKLEQELLQFLDHLRVPSEMVALFNAAVLDAWKQEQGRIRDSAAVHRRRLDELEGRKQRLFEAFVYQQVVSEEQYKEQVNRLDAEIAAIRIQATDADDQLDVRAVLAFTQKALTNPSEFWRELPLEQKQRFLRVLTPDGFTVTESGHIGTVVTSHIYKHLAGTMQ